MAAAALAAPLALGLFPRIRLPAIVLEIVLGILIGPQVLGWFSVDTPIQVLSLLGLASLLLLTGLEIDYERFRRPVLRFTAVAYAVSLGIAVLIGLGCMQSDSSSRRFSSGSRSSSPSSTRMEVSRRPGDDRVAPQDLPKL